MDPAQSERTVGDPSLARSTEKRDSMWSAESSAPLEDCVIDNATGTAPYISHLNEPSSLQLVASHPARRRPPC
eukprot:6685961-Pyramimonas_sp.AAC.1